MAAEQSKEEDSAEGSRFGKGFAVGMVVGVTLAGFLNPYDRALYLMVVNRRPFLSRANFTSPYQGFSQSLLVRSLSGGAFYPLFDVSHRAVSGCLPYVLGRPSSMLTNILAGQLTGALTAVVMNPLSAVRFQMWGKTSTMLHTMQVMWKTRGVAAFTNGTQVTMTRDGMFGMVYAGSRDILHRRILPWGEEGSGRPSTACNLIAATMATHCASPLNYARNMKFGCAHDEVPPTVRHSLRALSTEVLDMYRKAGRWPAACYLQQRLGLGWATLRVGIGMSLGQHMYDTMMREELPCFSPSTMLSDMKAPSVGCTVPRA